MNNATRSLPRINYEESAYIRFQKCYRSILLEHRVRLLGLE